VKTPLWTEGSPGSGVRYGISDETALTPDSVASAISEVVESSQIPGGAIFEIALGGTRLLPEWNISPPPGWPVEEDGKGSNVRPQQNPGLLGPILEVTEAERGKLRPASFEDGTA
jgi:hypothetical protein